MTLPNMAAATNKGTLLLTCKRQSTRAKCNGRGCPCRQHGLRAPHVSRELERIVSKLMHSSSQNVTTALSTTTVRGMVWQAKGNGGAARELEVGR